MRHTVGKLIHVGNTAELDLIERIRRRLRGSRSGRIRIGIGDDCALLRPKPGEEVAVTTDLSVETRHFQIDLHPPEAVGHRALARGLSDLAAMGALPVASFLSLGLRADQVHHEGRRKAWIDRFLDGFLALSKRHRTILAGGDLAESPLAMADIVLVGVVPRGRAMLRSGARPGDIVYSTGSLGGSSAGLKLLGIRQSRAIAKTPADKLAPHLWPEPRIKQGLWLRSRGMATAAIDLSDGLSTDLDHLCHESGVAVEIQADSLPLFPGATMEDALHGGEDYELLFTARPATKIPRRILGVSVTQIGRIAAHRGSADRILMVDGSGSRPLPRRGWEHFRS